MPIVFLKAKKSDCHQELRLEWLFVERSRAYTAITKVGCFADHFGVLAARAQSHGESNTTFSGD